MNVAGLNNLGFSQPMPNKLGDGKPMVVDKEKPISFGQVLDATKENAKTPDVVDDVDLKDESGVDMVEPLDLGESLDISSLTNSLPQAQPSRVERSVIMGVADANSKNVKPEIAKQMAVAAAPAAGADGLTRRAVWNDFLRKMNDLGISAEDVLKAFGRLSEKELAQPPEQSVDKVVMALGLTPPQAQAAKQFFNELIAKTNSKSIGEELSTSDQSVRFGMIAQQGAQKRSLQKSLDHMNNEFFVKAQPPTAAVPVEKPQAQEPREKVLSERPSDSDKGTLLATALPASSAPAALAVAATPTPTPSAETSVAPQAKINNLVDQMQPAEAGDKKSIDEIIRNFNTKQNAQAVIAPQALPPQVEGVPVAQTLVPTSPALPAGAVAPSLFADGAGSDKADAGDDDNEKNGQGTSLTATSVIAGDARTSANGKTEFQNQMTQAAGATAQKVSVPELVQNAQVMVREGGGDMKVTLKQEGLGEVAMRVSVMDGKVNVTMVTQTDEAKKMIEHQLGDLKSGLTANHLQVESIKVDTAAGLGKQLEQQYQDAQRQQAQANLEQFRQDHQGWRRSFFEPAAVNPYMSQGEAPRDLKLPHASARATGNRRLDLVA